MKSPLESGDTHALQRDLADELLRSSGKMRLRAIGRSMLPTVWPGDTLVIERVSSEVCEGDIVLFSRNRRFVAHRVVARSGETGELTIQTKGDAAARPDLPVSEHDLLGRVAFIQRNGRCIEPCRRPRISERAVAALVRNSDIAARVVVGVHGLRQTF